MVVRHGCNDGLAGCIFVIMPFLDPGSSTHPHGEIFDSFAVFYLCCRMEELYLLHPGA